MNVGSLFSGIGGFDLGFERAGMRVLWQCESDEFCRTVLAHHWPDTICYADVRDVHAARAASVDVLCGGFPCQPVSLAGRGLAQADERWLWPEFARVVGELRPRYVVVENVSGLLGRGLGDVLGDLAAIGYDAEWDCLPASAVGAPHQRDRVWIVAYPASDDGGSRRPRRPAASREGQPQPVRSLQDANAYGEGRRVFTQHHSGPHELGRRAPRRHPDGLRDEVADTHSSGRNGRPGQLRESRRREPANGSGEQAGTGSADWWATEPDVGRVAHGIPRRVDRLRALGNALVPQVAEWIGRRLMAYEATHAFEQFGRYREDER